MEENEIYCTRKDLAGASVRANSLPETEIPPTPLLSITYKPFSRWQGTQQGRRKHPVSVSREKLEADWLRFLEGMQPAFDALVNVLPVLAKANAHKRIEDAEQRQRHLATQLSEKKALRNSLIESKLRGELKQEEFREMADMIAHDIEGIEAAQRAFVAEAEAALKLTVDTSRTTIPANALWASAHLTDKLTVQNALFPEGILYRTDIGFFEPPDNELQAMVFRILLANIGEPDWEEIESGRGDWI